MEAVSTNLKEWESPHYEDFLSSIRGYFGAIVADEPLFTTDVDGLFDLFLDGFSEGAERQHYTCDACRQFVRRYGGLVAINANTGKISPVMWPDPADVTTEYVRAIGNCWREVNSAKVTGVFLSKKKVWGTPITEEWHHMHVHAPMVHQSLIQTPGQTMAEKKQDYQILSQSLSEFSLEAVEMAITLLKMDALYRVEKVLGVAEWFYALQKACLSKHGPTKRNLIWHAVAKAPPGWCHIRSTMIGTLLVDLESGLPFDEVKRKFSAKMHPLQYQRPQVVPARGNVEQAEKVVEQMGIANSLKRQFARLEEVQGIWSPRERQEQSKGEGVFGHLQVKGGVQIRPQHVSCSSITWAKFERDVLPSADKIEYHVPSGRVNFSALVTAVDMDAPPILQWDTEEKRNPVSWYVYNGGSPASQWGLVPNQWCQVTKICMQPSQWTGEHAHHGESVAFLLEGACDQRDSGLALFPEILKSELHGIRATIEAYSRAGKLEGREEASACGIRFSKDSKAIELRVTIGTIEVDYRLDRWE